MADSIRQQILTAFTAAMTTGTTGMVTVDTKRIPWWEWDISKFPAACILEGSERKSRFAYLASTASTEGDMHSELEVNVIGYAFDRGNNLDVKRTDLLRDIENGVRKSTTLNDLTLDIINDSVETDQGTQENWAIVHCKYLAKYIYNHGSP